MAIYLDPSNKAGLNFICMANGMVSHVSRFRWNGDRLYQWRLEIENIFALFGFLVLIKISLVAFIAYTVRTNLIIIKT